MLICWRCPHSSFLPSPLAMPRILAAWSNHISLLSTCAQTSQGVFEDNATIGQSFFNALDARIEHSCLATCGSSPTTDGPSSKIRSRNWASSPRSRIPSARSRSVDAWFFRFNPPHRRGAACFAPFLSLRDAASLKNHRWMSKTGQGKRTFALNGTFDDISIGQSPSPRPLPLKSAIMSSTWKRWLPAGRKVRSHHIRVRWSDRMVNRRLSCGGHERNSAHPCNPGHRASL